MSAGWRLGYSHGDAGAFHSGDPAAQRSATFHTVDRPTLVLGSAQPDTDVDQRVAGALGVDVVRRRSGGGAVLLWPGEFVWLDLVLPAGDPLWLDDVGHAMEWVGDLWQAALADLGVTGHVHRGALVANDWSRQVCFAGTGTGEVLHGEVAEGEVAHGEVAHGEAKLVGVSQRRTRSWARFQSMCHLRWRPEIVAALVAPPRPRAAVLAPAVRAVAVDRAALQAALIRHLP